MPHRDTVSHDLDTKRHEEHDVSLSIVFKESPASALFGELIFVIIV
jgi:hypothetical protein